MITFPFLDRTYSTWADVSPDLRAAAQDCMNGADPWGKAADMILQLRRARRDWHQTIDEDEPACGSGQWRTRDRHVVMAMRDMTDGHLDNCIRFAQTKVRHRGKLEELLDEKRRRTK